MERRAEIIVSIQAETGIDEAMIQRLVRGFYRRVREDPLIGPVFAARILDWEPHLRGLLGRPRGRAGRAADAETGCVRLQSRRLHMIPA